ncbi:MAG: hypothetical protein PHR25_00345 [Clostridia bacterium]|nr:hypothetical protein [Clostridia bacterium]MDD4375223.1 hypothetical protein [Clostridia bacterium]
MGNLQKNLEIVKTISNTIKKLKNITWILTGSTALALQGVNVPVNDIDIITDEISGRNLDESLSDYCIQKYIYSSNDKYQSYYGIYRINDVKVEIMGNFQYKLKDGNWSKENHLHEVKFYNYNNTLIPILSLEQELEEYYNTGKTNTAEKIEGFLKNNK